ncbi:MAG: nucleotide exchange factor GrpE [Candidatus Paceibacterota bacterium]
MDEEKKQTEDTKTDVLPADTNDKAEEYLNNWKRERADFLNYKKDEFKRLSEFAKFANEGVLMEVIELMDDLETASKKIDDPGLAQIIKKLEEFLKKYDIEKIAAKKDFDPALHEAVSTEARPRQAEGEAGEGGDKIEEVRAGYKMHDKIIRPARVKIIKNN